MLKTYLDREAITNIWFAKLVPPGLAVPSRITLRNTVNSLFGHLCTLSQEMEPSAVNSVIDALGVSFLMIKLLSDINCITDFARELCSFMCGTQVQVNVIFDLLTCNDEILQELSAHAEHAQIFRDFHNKIIGQSPIHIGQPPPATEAIKRSLPPNPEQQCREAKRANHGPSSFFHPPTETVSSGQSSSHPIRQPPNVSNAVEVCLWAIDTLKTALPNVEGKEHEKLLKEVYDVWQDNHKENELPPLQNLFSTTLD